MTQHSSLFEAYKATVHEMSKDDPLQVHKSTAFEVYHAILALLKDDRGVHVETAFGLIGALAGHICAEIGWAHRLSLGDRFDPRDIETFALVETKTGQRYVLGNTINKWFVDDRMSFCRLVLAGAEHFGATDLPSIDDIARNTIQLFCTEAFGQPRLPADHCPALLPLELVRRFGPPLMPKLTMFSDKPEDVVLSLAFTAQTLMNDAKKVIDPGLAAHILIECAFPMARTHPDDV